MVNRVSSGVGSLPDIIEVLKATGQFGPAPITREMETYAQTYKDFLGTPDYAAKDQEATDFAKLQFALSLMGRGFAAMGAAPEGRESPAGTLGRTLIAPIAGDFSTIAGTLMKQRQATKTAREQEERAIKLAALTAGTSARDRLTDAAIKMLPKPADIRDTPYYVLQEKDDGTVDFARHEIDEDTFSGRLQVRLRDDGGLQHVRTNRLFELGPRQFISKADALEDYGLSLKPTDAKKPTIANLPQYVQKRVLKDGKLVLDPVRQYAVRRTTGTGTDAKTRVFLPGGDKPDEAITIGDEPGHYKIVEKTTADTYKENLVVVDKDTGEPVVDSQGNWTQVSLRGNKLFQLGSTDVYNQPDNTRLKALSKFDLTGAATGKGIDSKEFGAQFRGFMAGLSEQQKIGFSQQTMGGGLVFKPGEGNFDLDPTLPLPFVKADGGPIPLKQRARIAKDIKSQYYSVLKAVRPGTVGADLNSEAARAILGKTLDSWGLKFTPGSKIPLAAMSDSQKKRLWAEKAKLLRTPGSDAGEILGDSPNPNPGQLSSIMARAVLLNSLAPNLFSSSTTASVPEDVRRDEKVENLNAAGVVHRIIAETAIAEPTLVSTLNSRATPQRSQQQAAIGNAIKEKTAQYEKKLGSASAAETRAKVEKGLHVMEMLDKAAVLVDRSHLPSFFTGMLEVSSLKYFGGTPFFRTPEGEKAALELATTITLLKQLVARDKLKESGEKMFSKGDLAGMQKVLVNVGTSEKWTVAALKTLRDYTKTGLQSVLNRSSSFDPGDETLRRAVALGFSLDKVKPGNGVYSPYFSKRVYPATKAPVPSFSEAYKNRIRNAAILEYTAFGGRGTFQKSYKLKRVDADNKPVMKKDANNKPTGYDFIVVPASVISGNRERSPLQQRSIDYELRYLKNRFDIRG